MVLPFARQYHCEALQFSRQRHLHRRVAVIDPRARFRIRAMVKEDLNSEHITFGYRHVERRVIVNAALVRVCAERQQQPDDLGHIRPSCCS